MSQPTISRQRHHRPNPIRPRLVARALGFWTVLATVGVLNGIFRGLVFERYVDAYTGHVVSTLLTGLPAFTIVMFLYFRSTTAHTDRELLIVGGLWTALTVGFEFGFGRFVMGHPWSRLLADYNLLAGRLWVLVLLLLLFGPLLIGRRLRR